MKKSAYSLIFSVSIMTLMNFEGQAAGVCKQKCLSQKDTLTAHCLTDRECEDAVLLSCVKNCEPDVSLVSMRTDKLTPREQESLAKVCEGDQECIDAKTEAMKSNPSEGQHLK